MYICIKGLVASHLDSACAIQQFPETKRNWLRRIPSKHRVLQALAFYGGSSSGLDQAVKMTSHTRINRLRCALAEGDAKTALTLLDQIRSDQYPKALLRPLLASCHQGLEESFLDLDLVPASLLIAPCLPAALEKAPLDERRLSLTHGCTPFEFVTQHLNEVLRGERPLYEDLPALDIHTYRDLAHRSPTRCNWLISITALECMALEAVIGIQSEDSALKRWCRSHDALLERPWIVIGSSNGQIEIDHRSVDLPEDGIKTITTAEEASALIEEATDHLLKEGATYLLWNKAGNPQPTGSP